jgi:hypothetical protein
MRAERQSPFSIDSLIIFLAYLSQFGYAALSACGEFAIEYASAQRDTPFNTFTNSFQIVGGDLLRRIWS